MAVISVLQVLWFLLSCSSQPLWSQNDNCSEICLMACGTKADTQVLLSAVLMQWYLYWLLGLHICTWYMDPAHLLPVTLWRAWIKWHINPQQNFSVVLFCASQRKKNEPSVLFFSPAAKPNNSEQSPSSPAPRTSLSASKCDPKHKDCLLREFRKLCAMVAENPSYNTKTQIIHNFLQKGSTGGRTVHTLNMLFLWKAQDTGLMKFLIILKWDP